MLIYTMNAEEVREHCRQDIIDMSQSAGWKAWTSEAYKLVRANSKKRTSPTHTYKSKKTGIRYLIYFSNRPGTNFRKGWIETAIYAPMVMQNGKISYHNVTPSLNTHEGLHVITHHFIYQYRKRLSLTGYSDEDVLRHIQERSYYHVMIYKESESSAVYCCEQGIVMRVEENGFVYSVTFVNKERLQDTQRIAFDNAIRLVTEMDSSYKDDNYINEYRKPLEILLKINQNIYGSYFDDDENDEG